MKKICYSMAVMCTFVLFAIERPEPVPSKITELRTKNWYQEISESWKTYLIENPTDEAGWINYVKAAKYAGNGEALAEITQEVSRQFADSFITHYLAFKAEGWTPAGILRLEKALALSRSTSASLEDQLTIAELKNSANRAELSGQVFKSGLIHSSTLNYNYNLLMSVSEHGLLITDALHTTIPIWILQDVMGVRTDVSVLNLELARASESYVTRVLAEKKLNVSVDDLLGSNNDTELFYALTLPREHLLGSEDHLYVTGLASTNGSATFNHFETLRANMEDKFLMDYLTIDFNGEPKTATGNVLSSNYIVPLLLLKEFYDKLNNEERSEEIKDQILALAHDSQIKTRVELLLNSKKSPRTFKIVEIDIKTLDKRMMKVKNKLYASEIELSNRDFYFYMEYLRTNEYTDLFKKGLVDFSKYDGVTQALLGNYHYSQANAQMNEKKRPGGSYFDYPVLDITYETAQAYCEWLTVQYNAQDKRKFKKVVFRLPSKEEWTMAALGYKEFTSWNLQENKVVAWSEATDEKATYDLGEYKVSYPWFTHWEYRNSVRNSKDCYLANVKVPEEVTCPAGIKGDGFTFASPVATYFSNNMGLYDVIGNVAEMTATKGLAMGGSWNHPEEEATITSENAYEGSDISVGFRLFMEVIEE